MRMERETRVVVFNMMILICNYMLVNVYAKSLLKDNDVINVKLVITILITIIHRDVKVCSMERIRRENDCLISACDCHPYGIVDKQCDTTTGMCQCKPHVVGQRCDQCQVFPKE